MKFTFFLFICLPVLAFNQSYSLFDGVSLKGWKQLNGQAVYKVINKEIVGTTVANTPNSFLVTEKEYDDFVLDLDLMVDSAMNSGIQIRSLSLPEVNNGRVHGHQIEVDPSPRAWSGGIYDEARRGWLYIPDINTKAKTAFKQHQWNHYKIEAIGPEIRTWLNGVQIAHLIDDHTLKGFIALQVHAINKPEEAGRKIKWKNIKLQIVNSKKAPLDISIPIVNLTNQISEAELKQGFVNLLPSSGWYGWRSVHSTSAPNKRWKNENGEFIITKSDGSETGNDILSEKKYSAFELVFDFKLTEGANSGLKYFVDEQYDSGGKSGIGLEYQILDDARHPDAKQGVVGNRTLASLYDLIPSAKLDERFKSKIGEWNHGRLIVNKNNWVQHWLNGFKVVEYERNSNIFKALVARSKYAGYPGFASASSGHILLQDHGDEVHFKNVKIREIN